MPAIFITGTDTCVGKTLVTGLMGRYLLEKGHTVITQKWIQTGSENFPDDIDTHLRLMQRNRQDIYVDLPIVAPYTFKFPSSPHLAAKLEGNPIRPQRIRRSFKLLSEKYDYVIVEGTGGSLVPINSKRLIIDVACELDLPVLIVAQNRLGSINHSILTIEALQSRNMKILGIIFNGQNTDTDEKILKDNPEIIKKLTRVNVLGSLPWMTDENLLFDKFITSADRIISLMESN